MNAPTILRGDARSLPLGDDSVDLIVTSPPYYGLRSYQDGGEHYDGQLGDEATPSEYVDALIDCTREWMRVLKPSGSIFVNLGDKYASNPGQGFAGMDLGTTETRTAALRRDYRRGRRPSSVPLKSLMLLPERYRIRCVDELRLTARAVMIWDKPNGLPESVTDRVRRSHEDWVHLTMQPRYYAAVDEIREPHVEPGGRPGYGRRRPPAPGGNRGTHVGRMDHAAHRDMGQHVLGRLPSSVWEIATQPLVIPEHLDIDHYAAFPVEWPRRLILGWCPPNGTVLDPCGGTGTTALVATMLGRIGITVDASADYCRLAQWRCSDPGERAKAAQVQKPPPVDPQQADLFGAVS